MSAATARIADAEQTVIQLEGVLDGVAARRVEAAIARTAPGARLRVDLTHIRDFHDFGVAVLAQALARSRAVVELRGLRRHQLRILGYFGVDAEAADHALSTTWPDGW